MEASEDGIKLATRNSFVCLCWFCSTWISGVMDTGCWYRDWSWAPNRFLSTQLDSIEIMIFKGYSRWSLSFSSVVMKRTFVSNRFFLFVSISNLLTGECLFQTTGEQSGKWTPLNRTEHLFLLIELIQLHNACVFIPASSSSLFDFAFMWEKSKGKTLENFESF